MITVGLITNALTRRRNIFTQTQCRPLHTQNYLTTSAYILISQCSSRKVLLPYTLKCLFYISSLKGKCHFVVYGILPLCDSVVEGWENGIRMWRRPNLNTHLSFIAERFEMLIKYTCLSVHWLSLIWNNELPETF